MQARTRFVLPSILAAILLAACAPQEATQTKRIEYTPEYKDSAWKQTLWSRIQDGPRKLPEAGVVFQKEAAVRIALSVLEPIFGAEQIESEKPFHATLYFDEYWHVAGTLPEGYFGGVAEVILSKKDGRIVSITHGK